MKKLLTILTAAMMMTTLAAAETGTPTDLGTPFADVTATPPLWRKPLPLQQRFLPQKSLLLSPKFLPRKCPLL